MTNRVMTKFELKQLIEVVNAWRSRVLTISGANNIEGKVKLINELGLDMRRVSEILEDCVVEDFDRRKEDARSRCKREIETGS